MQIFKEPAQIQAQCAAWRASGETIALVPTMGYYHAGHESLMDHGRRLGDKLVVSLFVNPAQFGPNEDFDAYPRNFERDCEIAAKHGVDAIFAPEPAAMYAPGHATWVEAPDLANCLCGKSRPTHFRGVCTVVLKLLSLTGANFAIFGQKDWQQQAIIRRMARDLNLPVEIVAMPIARDKDGLALSSRNVYLSDRERRQAPTIRRGLELAAALVQTGETNVDALRQATQDYWDKNMRDYRVDYLSVVDPDTLAELDSVSGQALMAAAVFLGRTRLIDNILLNKQD